MSMQSVASPATLHAAEAQFADAYPGDEGWPLIGKTLECSPIPRGRSKGAAKYGLVYRSHLFGETSIILLGPEANELVLFDQAKHSPPPIGWGGFSACCFRAG